MMLDRKEVVVRCATVGIGKGSAAHGKLGRRERLRFAL